ncbi:phosphatase 2C-like domain-containing protein [Chytridium lagenaria]|nr:phosphatase 2C-like domain-containing protein [Chytridium lagenaria]
MVLRFLSPGLVHGASASSSVPIGLRVSLNTLTWGDIEAARVSRGNVKTLYKLYRSASSRETDTLIESAAHPHKATGNRVAPPTHSKPAHAQTHYPAHHPPHQPVSRPKPAVGGMGIERSQADAKLKANEKVVVLIRDEGEGWEERAERVWEGPKAGDGMETIRESLPGVVRFDVGCVPSNEPCEDAQCQISLGNGRYMFGVFDGHNGPECAHMISSLLPSLYSPRLSLPPKSPITIKVERAIRSAFSRLDDDLLSGGILQDPRYSTRPVPWAPTIVRTPQSSEWDKAFTAKVAKSKLSTTRKHSTKGFSTRHVWCVCSCGVVEGNDVYVACTGDSGRCWVGPGCAPWEWGGTSTTCWRSVSGGAKKHVAPTTTATLNTTGVAAKKTLWRMEAVDLTVDQTGRNPSERARLINEHPGEEETVVIRGRLWDRSEPFSHYLTPPYLTADPIITRHKIDPKRDRFLVLATDGLFDELESDEVVDIVASHMVRRKSLNAIHDETQWALEDENAATALIRNALGGGNDERLCRVLAIPSPYSRRFRDDITVNVLFFDDVLGIDTAKLGGLHRPHVDVDKLRAPRADETKVVTVVVKSDGETNVLADLKPQRMADILKYLEPTPSKL